MKDKIEQAIDQVMENEALSDFEENMKRLEPELNRAIQRRNIDRDVNGYPITLANGNPPTAEEVRRVVDRALNGNGGVMKCSDGSYIRDGLRGEEEHLADTIKRKNKNPKAGVEEVRRHEVIDTRVVTWDDSIAQSKRSIADSKQYIADVELAGKWYGYWLQAQISLE